MLETHWSTLAQDLHRLARLPLPELFEKLARNACALASAPFYLAGCAFELGARTVGRPVVHNRGSIHIGTRTAIISSVAPVQLEAGEGGSLIIGRGCVVNFGALLSARRSVVIGDGALVGPYCVVCDAEAPGETPRPIEIGAGAWLAARVTVLPGARIGRGAAVAAGSIVSGEIPAGVLAGGIPARVIRPLGARPASMPAAAREAAP